MQQTKRFEVDHVGSCCERLALGLLALEFSEDVLQLSIDANCVSIICVAPCLGTRRLLWSGVGSFSYLFRGGFGYCVASTGIYCFLFPPKGWFLSLVFFRRLAVLPCAVAPRLLPAAFATQFSTLTCCLPPGICYDYLSYPRWSCRVAGVCFPPPMRWVSYAVLASPGWGSQIGRSPSISDVRLVSLLLYMISPHLHRLTSASLTKF